MIRIDDPAGDGFVLIDPHRVVFCHKVAQSSHLNTPKTTVRFQDGGEETFHGSLATVIAATLVDWYIRRYRGDSERARQLAEDAARSDAARD